jgi:integrase
MTAAVARFATQHDHLLLDGYARFCHHADFPDRALRDRLRLARLFLAEHPDLKEWMNRPTRTRLADLRRIQAWPLLSWAALSGRVHVDLDLLAAKELGGLSATARKLWPEEFERLWTTARRLEWSYYWGRSVIDQFVPAVIAWSQTSIASIDAETLDGFAAALEEVTSASATTLKQWRGRLFGLRQLLFECGQLPQPPQRGPVGGSTEQRLAAVSAPGIRRAMIGYVAARAAVLSRSSVNGLVNDLIIFGEFLAGQFPDITSLTELERRHIEAFLAWNRTRTWRGRVARDQRVSVSVVHGTVLTVRNFLDDINLWGWADRPSRRLIFASDVPRLPRPLPRALAPDTDTALITAVGNLDDLFARSAILLLRRTGLRLGECLDLELGCVVDYGPTGTWLRVPLGKLGTERAVPLDAATVAALDAWAQHRGPQRSHLHPRSGKPTDFLFAEHGRRLSAWRIREGLRAAAAAAGLTGPGGKTLAVTPHRLRHTYATELANAGMSLQALMAVLGHYAGDLVKGVLSGGGLIESGEQSVEHFLTAELSFFGGVVALCLQGRAEFDGGLEESAGFADGFEVAVQADGPGAVAVAEHPAVHLDTQLAHFSAFGLGGQCAWLVVEGFDLFADGEVFVGDGAVGDSGINEGHPHRSVPQQRGQRFEGHATVDRLGRQSMPEAVGRNMTDASRFRGLGDCPIDAAFADALAVLDEQVAAAQAGGSSGDPGVEEILELGMQGDVAVGAQFPERHVQPVRGADLHDGIDCEIEEFALAQACAGQELHAQSHERVVGGACGLQQLGERGVVEEAGQRVVTQRQIAGEHEHAGGGVVAVPFGEPLEAGAQGAKVFGETDLGQPGAAGRGPGGQVQLVGLNVCPTQVGDAEHLGGIHGQPAGELAQHALNAHHRRGPQRQPGLGDITGEGGGQPWRDRSPLGGPLGRAVWGCFAGRGVKDAEVEQSGLRTEQRRAKRLGAMTVRSVTSYRGGQRFSLLVDHRLGQPLGSQPGQRCHLGQRRPLQAGHDGVKPELGGGRGEPFVEPAVMMGGDFAEVGPARHEIVGAGPQPARHDQPTDHPSLLQRQCALRCQRQSRPAGHPNAGEKRARHRGHRVSGEHPGRDEVGPIRLDELLDVVAMCW